MRIKIGQNPGSNICEWRIRGEMMKELQPELMNHIFGDIEVRGIGWRVVEAYPKILKSRSGTQFEPEIIAHFIFVGRIVVQGNAHSGKPFGFDLLSQVMEKVTNGVGFRRLAERQILFPGVRVYSQEAIDAFAVG